MRYLAIDPGAYTGFCWGDVGGRPNSGVYKVPKHENPLDPLIGRRMNSLERFLIEVLKHNKIDRCFYEEPYTARGKMADKVGYLSNVTRYGYPVVIAMACDKVGVRCSTVPIQTWRSLSGVPTQAPKRVTGTEPRRKWLKAFALTRCAELGYEVKTDDEADATLIWHAMAGKHLAKEASPDLFEQVRL